MRWTWPRLAGTAAGVFLTAGAATVALFPTTGAAPAPALPAAGAPIVPAGIAPPPTTPPPTTPPTAPPPTAAPAPIAAEAPASTATRQERAARPGEDGPRDAPRPGVGKESADDDGPKKDKEKGKGPKDDHPGKGHGKDR